jgi:hypothetical protein
LLTKFTKHLEINGTPGRIFRKYFVNRDRGRFVTRWLDTLGRGQGAWGKERGAQGMGLKDKRQKIKVKSKQ